MQSLFLFTIGYENKKIEDFVSRLKHFGVTALVDVREVPISRKPGFSKSGIKKYLEQANIKYIHAKELGSPKKLRQKLYDDNNYDYFFNEYSRYLEKHLDIVAKLYWDTIVHDISCLMCMEEEPSYCHRKVVAERIKVINGNGLIVRHI